MSGYSRLQGFQVQVQQGQGPHPGPWPWLPNDRPGRACAVRLVLCPSFTVTRAAPTWQAQSHGGNWSRQRDTEQHWSSQHWLGCPNLSQQTNANQISGQNPDIQYSLRKSSSLNSEHHLKRYVNRNLHDSSFKLLKSYGSKLLMCKKFGQAAEAWNWFGCQTAGPKFGCSFAHFQPVYMIAMLCSWFLMHWFALWICTVTTSKTDSYSILVCTKFIICLHLVCITCWVQGSCHILLVGH